MESTCPITTSESPEQPGSQVAACLKAIEAEYTAAQRGLSGYAETSRHAFITARMEGMQASHEQLIGLVGSDAAIHMVAKMLDQIQEVHHAS